MGTSRRLRWGLAIGSVAAEVLAFALWRLRRRGGAGGGRQRDGRTDGARVGGGAGSPGRMEHSGSEAAPDATRRSTRWRTLGWRAKTWRMVHATWSVAQLTALAYMWACVVTGRRSPRLWAAVGFLAVEGGALVVGRGDCPVGPLQAQWGDPVPFFELVLPPRAAKAAVPVLAVLGASTIAALVLRRPGLVMRS